MVSEYNTVENETILVIVVPESEELLTFSGDFKIVDMIVANSEGEVNVDMLNEPIMVTEFSLSTAYPNPFNPVTSFEYTIPEDGMVQVAIYDISGRMVSELVNEYQSAGTYPVVWDAQKLSSGVYMVNMTAGDYSTIQKKVMLIK